MYMCLVAPPIPEAITYGILELHKKIDAGRTIRRKGAAAAPTEPPRTNVHDMLRPGYVKMPTAQDYAAHLDEDIDEYDAQRRLLQPGVAAAQEDRVS